jgi:hypothetical protein
VQGARGQERCMERGRGGRETEGKRGQEREREREREKEREKGGRPMACGVRGSLWPGWCCRSCRGWSRQPAVHSYVSMRSVHGQYMVSIQSAYSLHAVSTWSACSQLTACIWASHGQHTASIRPHTVRRSPASCSTQLCQHAACTRPVHG